VDVLERLLADIKLCFGYTVIYLQKGRVVGGMRFENKQFRQNGTVEKVVPAKFAE